MKKQDVLESLRKAAIDAYEIHEEYMTDQSDARRLAGALCALKNTVIYIFGWDSEEAKEFDYYFKNRFEQFPQPKQIDA